MVFRDVMIAIVLAAVVGGVILAVLWPGPRQGRRVLVRWGVLDPGDAEIADAVRYLQRRRFWYPWVSLAGPALASAFGVPESWASTWTFLGVLVIGALLAEVVAQRPSRGLRRAAVLVPRRVSDVLSVWSIGAFVALAAGTLVVSGAGLAGAQWALRVLPDPGPVLVGALVVTVAGTGIVWLAVRRPSSGESRADNALRLRSARVGAGLTMAGIGAVFATGGSTVGGVVALAGLFCWIATVNPPRSVLREIVGA